MAGALRGWGKDQDLQIKWGSFYTVVRNLAKHGMLEEAASGRAGRRPARTVYRITPAGLGQAVLPIAMRLLLKVAMKPEKTIGPRCARVPTGGVAAWSGGHRNGVSGGPGSSGSRR